MDMLIFVVALIGIAAGAIITIAITSKVNHLDDRDDEPMGDMVDVKGLMKRWDE